jgi:dehydrogenase/reductase SDR family member 7B
MRPLSIFTNFSNSSFIIYHLPAGIGRFIIPLIMNFKNKKIWITGASSGIGEALAMALADEGAHLILSARNEAELKRVKMNCIGAEQIDIVLLDIGNHEDVFKIAKETIAKVGNIDILINNAGISQRSLAKDTDFQVDTHIINVDLLGTIAITKAVLPSMLAQKSGHIVTVSSLMGKFGAPLRSGYAAAKHGLHGFFDTLRAELFDDNIKVLMVCPGFVKTNISMNAVVGDGSKQGTMDDATDKGLDPSVVAAKIIKAIRREKEEIYLGGREVMGVYMKRFFPRILSRIVRKAKTT